MFIFEILFGGKFAWNKLFNFKFENIEYNNKNTLRINITLLFISMTITNRNGIVYDFFINYIKLIQNGRQDAFLKHAIDFEEYHREVEKYKEKLLKDLNDEFNEKLIKEQNKIAELEELLDELTKKLTKQEKYILENVVYKEV